MIEQRLCFLAAQQLIDVRLDDFRQVRRNHSRRIDDGVSRQLGSVFFLRLDPDGRQPESRICGRHAGQCLASAAAVDGKNTVDIDFSSCNLHAFEKDGILLGIELQIVRDVDRRYNDPQIGRNLSANGFDPRKKVSALIDVHQADQRVAHFNRQWINFQQRFNLVGLGKLFRLFEALLSTTSWSCVLLILET